MKCIEYCEVMDAIDRLNVYDRILTKLGAYYGVGGSICLLEFSGLCDKEKKYFDDYLLLREKLLILDLSKLEDSKEIKNRIEKERKEINDKISKKKKYANQFKHKKLYDFLIALGGLL